MRPTIGLVRCAGVPQPLKDRRTRRLQTLFGTVEVEAPRFKLCRYCRPMPLARVTASPVCALLTARRTPELERVQAELGARTSFRNGARILESLLPVVWPPSKPARGVAPQVFDTPGGDDRLVRLVAGIKAAAPDRTLQQIATQLEAMRERTPRGGTRWHPSSVKHLLGRAEQLGLAGSTSAKVAPDVWR